MSKEEILTYLTELPYEDNVFILMKLNTLVRAQEKDAKYRNMNEKYISTMKSLVGEECLSSQKRPYVQARVVLATCLMEDGQTVSSVARMLGVDHSTVSNYKTIWSNANRLPKVYADIINLYNKYRNALPK
jgi:predicted transcriptional regulator